jgi:hypothetical protein
MKDKMLDYRLKIEIEKLKKDIFSDNWELALSSADRLGKIGNDEEIDFLISLLLSDKSSMRNLAALGLRDNKIDRAIDPLLKAIFIKENYNNNGTMVYALELLDCSKKLVEIFKILFYQGFEAKLHSYSILSEQTFEFANQDLKEIKRMWEDCQLHPEKCPLYDNDETREMMQDAVEGYLLYLTK